MGYSPKHAKPVSLRGTALKTPLTGGAGNGPGRHRAGARIPGQRVPADEPVPAGAVPDPVTAPAVSEQAAPPAAGMGAGPGHAEESIASRTRPEDKGDRPAGNQAARAEALMRLVPLQRAPIPES